MSSPRLLIAALIAAVCLPATAQAATVELKTDGTLTVRAAAGEANNLHVAPVGVPGLRLRDFGAKLTVKGSGCAVTDITPSEVICAGNLRAISRVDIALLDGNDLYAGQHGFATIVDGGAGADQYFHDGKAGLTTTRTDFRGGDGDDTASYGPATAGVIVSKDGVANDGRTITGSSVIDRDNIRPDVEKLIGSPFNDSLNGSSAPFFVGKPVEIYVGGAGNDLLAGGPGEDFFDQGISADGADTIRGNGATSVLDAVSYANRTRPVVVTVGQNVHDDGEVGEQDDVTGVERVFGGKADDRLGIDPTSPVPIQIFAGTGNDALIGGGGGDFMNGDLGSDTYTSGAGADTIFAAHNDRDTIDCGTNPINVFDTASLDASEFSVKGCENSNVGKLSLRASGTDVTVAWTHPKAWRKLRSVTVRVLDAERNVGEITIDPKREKIAASGAVKLARTKLTREGKTVSARLALKVDRAFAGRKLAFEVEAIDVDGRRQVER